MKYYYGMVEIEFYAVDRESCKMRLEHWLIKDISEKLETSFMNWEMLEGDQQALF